MLNRIKQTRQAITANRLRAWGRQISEFALAQGLGQAAGMASGLIYVHYMPIDAYAVYALSLASLAMVNVGSDLGLTGSLNYFWRRSEQDWASMAPRIAAVRRLRSIFLIIAAIIAAVLLYRAALAQDISVPIIVICLLLVIATAALQMRSVVEIQLLRLRGMQRKSYFADAFGALARLAAAVGMIATGLTTAWYGLAGGLVGALVSLLVVIKLIGTSHNVPATVNRETWRELRTYLLPVMPGVLVFIVQDPLVLWMAATYGSKTIVAEVFALGRIAAIFGLLGSFVVIVITPRLSRISNDSQFTRMWFYLMSLLVLICAIAISLTLIWPSVPLILIGQKYAHLTNEIAIAVSTASITILLTFLTLANRVRGWVKLDPFVAIAQTVVIVSCINFWSYDQSYAILTLLLTLVSAQAIMTFCVSLAGRAGLPMVKARQ